MSLSDSSDSTRGRSIPVHKRKMVWSSSDGSEASSSGRPEPDNGAELSSEQRGDPSQFVARGDAIADIARDEDLPDDPEALAIQGAMAQRKKTRAKKVKKPDPPGSTLSTSDSLRDLKARFNFSEGVILRFLTPNERADDPPEGFFTLYKGFFYFCFLWFPIPRPIIEYLWSYTLALAQITTRGLRHLVGILIRGIETYNNVGLDHLRNLLEIRHVPSCKMERYYISPRSKRRVIGGFPSKDEKYTDHFFFVALDEDCVPEGCLGKMIGKWRKIDRGPSFLDRIPEDLFSVREELAARKCHWIKNFSHARVEKALRILHEAQLFDRNARSENVFEALVAAEQDARRKMAEESLCAQQKAEAMIESLNRLLSEEKALHEAEVARARRAAELEVAEQFAEKITATEAKLSRFDKVSERYIYFSQAKANAELIVELESGKKIEDEKEEVMKWKEEFGDAEAEYAKLGAELLEDLKISLVSPVSAHDGLGNRSVESDAVDAGVVNQAGTNLNPEAARVPDEEDECA
ncbi:hypothetical protein ISN44_Un166g000020 [Arabidopsis suecica]|uniref:Uncharacterized protein n=1 Tax=Arabidopsis suecica TaxID=45249 RepID=A0A8T1XFB5_ARASU|nr:hypothetical protein ISN44_Un166g000020 [Arabidopsis suecica]